MAMTMRRIDRLLVGVHHQTPPTSEEWSRWLELAAERAGGDLRTMVEVYGSVGPGPKQRLDLASLAKSLDLRAAIITDSIVTLGVVTAISWLGIPVRAYGKRQHAQASAYLELTPAEHASALALLTTLREQAGVPLARRQSLASAA